MAKGDRRVLPSGCAKHYQHLLAAVGSKFTSKKALIRFVGIGSDTYDQLLDEDFLYKSTAQKILNAYAKIAPYNENKKHAA